MSDSITKKAARRNLLNHVAFREHRYTTLEV